MLTTQRLLLRRWEKEDYPYMVSINSDPDVMRYFPDIQNEKQTLKMIKKMEDHFEKYGFGLYAVELLELGRCIGFVGLNYTDFKAHFTPAFEIGWRLDKNFWMQGYATEASRKVLQKAFTEFNLDRVVSFTSY